MLGLTRLLQLASPTLPVGAYSYSGGLESAIEDGIVTDARTAEAWIRDVLDFSLGSFEVPLLFRMMEALRENDYATLAQWNTLFRSGRETAELRTETLQMGHALVTLLKDLPFCSADEIAKLHGIGALTLPGRVRVRRASYARRARAGARRLSVELARKPGDGGAEGRAARAERRPAHARGHRRRSAGDRAARNAA